MRTRLTKQQRRSHILATARTLIARSGYTSLEMEHLRVACALSRGGLYHHFSNKRAVLAALVHDDIAAIIDAAMDHEDGPIVGLLAVGSSHLTQGDALLSALETEDDRQDYLASLETASDMLLLPRLAKALEGHLRPNIQPGHAAELFSIVNTHINRREILGQWTQTQAADFAATALQVFAPLLRDAGALETVIENLAGRVGRQE